MNFTRVIDTLKKEGIAFETGLDEQEINKIESLYEINIPPDLREFLGIGLPVSEGFVNWRDFSADNITNIKRRLNWPLEGIIFDIEKNGFWYSGWGIKPDNLKEAIEIFKSEMKKVPKLIPVYSHRYIPSEPQEIGNPIFSVCQTDIIYYGEDFLSYLQLEFGTKKHKDINYSLIKEIRFWVDLAG